MKWIVASVLFCGSLALASNHHGGHHGGGHGHHGGGHEHNPGHGVEKETANPQDLLLMKKMTALMEHGFHMVEQGVKLNIEGQQKQAP
jgi:hypothetical protein